MYFLKEYLILHAVFASSVLFGQCYYTNKAFHSGEIIEYNIKYNLGFIWIDAGFVSFSVDSGTYQGKPVYKFISKGSSYEKYDWIYKVRESFISQSYQKPLMPISFSRSSIEGDYFAMEDYFFNYDKKRVYSTIQNSKQAIKKDTLPLHNFAYDLLTAIYAFRNFDFENIKEGQKIPLTVIIDNKWEQQYLRFLKKEDFKSNNKIIPCYHIKASMLEGTIFHAGENTDIWITQSTERIPIFIEAKILVGTVKLYLKKYVPE